jgi:arsenate reductase
LRKIKKLCCLYRTAGKEYEIIKYRKLSSLTKEVVALKKKLKPVELVRKKRKIWIENFKNIKMTDEAIIKHCTYQFL